MFRPEMVWTSGALKPRLGDGLMSRPFVPLGKLKPRPTRPAATMLTKAAIHKGSTLRPTHQVCAEGGRTKPARTASHDAECAGRRARCGWLDAS
jgi:hypothetical protein